jgi:chromosome segregation ATPase
MENMADEQLQKILDIVQKIDKRSDTMDKRLMSLEKGQDVLRKDVATLHKGQDTMMKIIDDIAEKQDRLEEKQDHFDEGLKELKADAEKIIEELDRQRQEDTAGTYLLGEHGKDISKLDERVTKLEVFMA